MAETKTRAKSQKVETVVANDTIANPTSQATMVDLAIQPQEATYEAKEEDMGNGIKRITFLAKKD